MADEKVVYIHMGMYKTGTKSIQFFFTERRDFFIGNGVYYPYARGIDFYRHKQFFPFKAKKLESIRAIAEKKHCKTIVFSSDSLCKTGISDADLALLRKIMPDHAVKYVVYIKRIDDIVKDWYSETRKRNYSNDNYRQFIESQYTRKNTLLFPSKLLDHSVRQIGKENVIVRNYSSIQDTVQDFCSIIGVPLSQENIPGKQYNTSPSHKAIAYYTPSMFSEFPYGYAEVRLGKKLAEAFSHEDHGHIDRRVAKEVDKEIAYMQSAYLEDYGASFQKRPLNLDFPEIESDPYRIYMADLLHSIYRRVTWPERLLWRIGSLAYLGLIQIPGLQRILLRYMPFVESKLWPRK